MRKRLISSIAVSAFVLAASASAFAQAPPPAPVYSWTGWYVGGNAGVSLGTFKTDFNVAPSTFAETFPVGSFSAAIPGFAGRDEVYPGGFIGGGQIGFNWQLSPLWVVGAEADFQGADEKEHSNLTQNFSATVFEVTPVPGSVGTLTGTTALDYAAKIEWFGTVRLRAGYVFGDGAVLTYVTGGLAYGKVDVAGTSALTASGGPGPPLSITQAFDHSNVNTGWVVGTGTEGKLSNFPGWTYKIEGLYMDLGHLDATGPGGSSTFHGEGLTKTLTAGPVTTHTHFTDAIIRAGLNYQFH